MGKSKFPGKPSRLVTKKRVSVLSGAGLSTLASGCSSDEDNNQHQENSTAATTTTTEKLNHQQQSPIHSQQHQQQQQQQQKQNQQQQQPSPKASTLLDNEEIDQDGDEDVSKHAADDSDNSDDDDDDEEDEDESSSGYSDEDNDEVADLAASQPSASEVKDEDDDKSCAVSPATMAENKPQEKPSAPTGNNFEMKPSSLSAVAGAVSSQSLESSASVATQPQPTMAEGSKSTSGEQPSESAAQSGEAPPKPKKKSVTFHSTLESTDENVVKKVYNPTIQPLTPIIKRECLAHPIRLTKSYNRKMKKRKQRLAMLAAASKPECIVRPSRLTEVILKSSKLDEASQPPAQTTSLVQPSAFSASDPSLESSDTTTTAATSSSTEERNLESGGTQFGDKRFILPKRSAHSSRVIKPNKRFLDEFELEIKKKNKNLAAAQAAAAAAVAAGVPDGSVPASNSSVMVGDGFGEKLFKSDVTSAKSDDGIDSDKRDGESGEGEEGKKKKEKNKKDSEEQSRRIGKLGEKDVSSEPADGTSEPSPVRSASSISINNPFAKTSLLDGVSANGCSSTSASSNSTTLKLMKPSVLLTAATASTSSSSLASATSIFGKSILRQPRLQFTTSLLNSNPLASAGGEGGSGPAPERSTVSEGPFSLHLKAGTELDSSKIFSSALTEVPHTTPTAAVAVVGPSCSICGIADSGRHHQPGTEKHGIGCHTCRKFISMIKKRTKGPNPCGVLKCKNDSKCSVKAMVRPSHVRSNHIFKERCHVCWVRRCLNGFPLPPSLKATLTHILPPVHKQVDSTATAGSTAVRKESVENNIFSNSLSSGHPAVAASRILWNTSAEKSEFPKTSSFPSLTNPLAQNNSTFGSLPPIKLNISDKPLILAPSSLASPKAAKSPVLAAKEEISAAPMVEKNQEEPEPVASTTNPEVTAKVLRPRNKVEPTTPAATPSSSAPNVSTPPPTATTTSTVLSTTVTTATTTAPAVAADSAPPNDKRQWIDLKGPRVKHVCRSASIVLGQPLAMFPEDEDTAVPATLENIETPPSDSAAEGADEQPQPMETPKPSEELQPSCVDCKEEPPNLTLSPPATPVPDADTSGSTEKELVIDEDRLSESSTPTKEIEPLKSEEPEPPVEVAATPAPVDVKQEVDVKEKIEVARKVEEIERPATRKATSAIRPQVLKQNISAITKSFNTNVRTAATGQQAVPEVPNAPLISIDFWENYDPAEVSRTGFGLILSEDVPLKALCFLCGSSGLDELLFCVCCCEPYHQYCVKDEYNIRHASLDETNVSLLELTSTTTMANSSPAQQALNRFNWMCPRCTVCYTCNMATGTKVKCQKCCKNYHTTCLGTSKRLLGADRPMICAACLKCKSCSTTNVTKFIGNLPMCTPCFRLRQKGNFCPLCQRCYEENDFDLKMMECGDCQRWVHAKCEGLTDEQYNMLSALPENIEFICKKCGKNNESASVWRDAVAAEFKAGLLSVVKLLSKSRQACALLKLSPRKKTSNCTCLVSSGKSISFFSFGSSKEESSVASKKPKLDEDSIYDFNSESSSSSTSFPPATKCYCSLKPVKPSDISLVEIKQKINANEYYSLQDFNYDMNTLINSIGSEELSTAYKEFLSETFPWFQNETKACTDALEEAMCGEEMGTDYGLVPGGGGDVQLEQDQKVPSIDIPLDEIDDYFYECAEVKDTRACMLCKQQGEGLPLHESRLLYCGQNNWTHTNCALWSAEVFEEIDGSLQNVHSAASRGRLIKCCHCGVKGATVGCNVKNCGEHYHFPCARQINCTFMQDKTVYCPQHAAEATRKKCPVEKSFEINRSVYVELDRRKKKFVEPGKVQFMMGSLSVKKLGHIVPMFSDHPDAIIPTDFECTRLYWSSKEPWKIVEYRIKTTIQNNNYCHGTDAGKNFTVDHTMSSSSVHWGLTQINRWHSSLNSDEQEVVEPVAGSSGLQKEQKTMKQLLEAVCGPSDDTNDEEPQNNNDLLPQEIKDAIFEDIPHDILDGISMLDILPKLMTYDDLIAMDLKNENNFNAEILKEVNVGGGSSSSSSSTSTTNSSNATTTGGTNEMDVDEDDINEAIMKCSGSELSNDGWMKTISAPGIEDALLSAIKQPSSSRDLKRSVVRVAGQRSGSFSWNSKLESAAAKRRKISKLADVLSLGSRIKEDASGSAMERRKSLPNEEFSWSANKKSGGGESLSDGMNVFEKLKISQLDGMDDFCGDAGEMKIYSSNMMEAPVKCDRCHATYRNQESYQRHLNSCEVLSTSESDSETRSPRLLSPEQQQAQVATQLGAGTFILPQTSVAQTISTDMYGQINQNQHGNPTISVISGLNNQTINLNNLGNQAILSNIPASMPITINQLSSGIPIQTTAGTHQLQMQGALSNLGGNMIISNQGQLFAQPVNFQQTLDNQQAFVQNKQRFQSSQLPQTISLANNLMSAGNGIQVLQQQQPQQQQQIISIGPNGQPQIVTVTNPNQPQQQQIMQNQSQKKQLIFPSVSPKKSVMSKFGQSPTPIKAKRSPPSATVTNSGKAVHMKKQEPIAIQQAPTYQTMHPQQQQHQQQQQQQIQLINASYPLLRPTNAATPQQANAATAGNQIIFQQPNQPILVQQVGGNQISYVTDQNQVQYLAPTNVLTQNGFTLNTSGDGTLSAAPTNNILIPNGTGGYSMIPASALQLATAPQPQVIGTIIQPQATSIQCGMMSTEQMVLGATAGTPTLEMVTDPTSGCMYLTSPSVYYGLETIVQNTVMSSQQFVSTAAMQGVLSQNSSFSATTTQVFQASKIEPIVEVPTGYVVLNNDGTTSQLQTSNGMLQQAQIQPAPTQTPAPVVSQPMQTWKIEPQTTFVQQQPQPTVVNPLKSTSSSVKNIIPKTQTQLVNKVMPNTMIKTNPEPTINTSMMGQKVSYANASAVYTTTAAVTTTTKVSNVIKPITKTTTVNKPKIVAKPVKQQRQSLLSPQPQLQQQQIAQVPVSQPQLVSIKPSINSSEKSLLQPIVSVATHKLNNGHLKNSLEFIPTPPTKPTSLLKKPEVKSFPQRNTPNYVYQTSQAQQQQQPQSIQISAIPTSFSQILPTPPMVQTPTQPQPQKSLLIEKKQPSQITVSLAASSSSSSLTPSMPPTMSNSSITITPSQTASITLPTAPYPMQPMYSNIPTNVVNPIPQSNNSSNSISSTTPAQTNRPTNRVLPMQASMVLPKSPEVPQTPPPLKLLNGSMPCDKIDEISIIPSRHTAFSPEPSPPASAKEDHIKGSPRMEIEIKPIEPVDIGPMLPSETNQQPMEEQFSALEPAPQPSFHLSLNIDHHGSIIPITATTTMTTSSLLPPTIAEIEIKPIESDAPNADDNPIEMVKCSLFGDAEDMIAKSMQQDSMDGASSVDSRSMNDESESPEIKNKISEILDNLEAQTNEEDEFGECRDSDSSELLLKIEEEPTLGASSPIKSQEEQKLVEELNQELQASTHSSPASSIHHSELIIPSIFDSGPKKDIDSGYDVDHKENLDPIASLASSTPTTSSNMLATCSEPQQLPEELLKMKLCSAPQPKSPKTNSPKLLYEIQSQDGFTYKSTSIAEIWDKLFEAVQIARKAHGLQPLPEGQLEEMAGVQMLGLKTNAIRYLLEQLPGVEKCTQYQPQYHKKPMADITASVLGGSSSAASLYADYFNDIRENPYGAARCEPYSARSEYDMFSWLASRHRKQPPMPVVAQTVDDTIIPRRGSGSNLPMAMRYRTLKETSKESVGVYRSHIHGRGLFCNRDIEAGEMVIEYAGELIRSTLTDKRERYYDGRGIGCYMFKIDENFVVDATMRGNAARFINHSCEPNCYSKVVDILGHKHIIIFALRRIVQGEELTYDYKFPFEDVKIPCSCGSKKCRKYLN